ncbi:MAG: hypothetical protein LBJ48_04800 [Coriobacteriales bacterium]|nr:hypothetical protein [Coriobacteriales bacterium]
MRARHPQGSLGLRAWLFRFPRPRSSSGQATVEYLIVGVALIAIIVALGVFSGRVQEGLFVQHAADSASHAFTVYTAGSAGDVLLY